MKMPWSSSSSSSTLAKQVLLSLPPMGGSQNEEEKVVLKTIQKQVPGYQDAHLQAWKDRQCRSAEESGGKGKKGSSALSPLGEAIDHELSNQLEKQYTPQQKQDQLKQNNASTKFVVRHSVTIADGASKKSKQAAAAQSLIIRTYAELYEPHKCRTGYWSSEWNLTNASEGDGKKSAPSPGAASMFLSGTITMQVHYYEDDTNIQLRSQREVPPSPSGGYTLPSGNGSSSDPAITGVASTIVQDLQRFLNTYSTDLTDDLCAEPNGRVQASLKKVRRILPITKTRMKWDDAAQEQIRVLNDTKAQKPMKPSKGTKKKPKK